MKLSTSSGKGSSPCLQPQKSGSFLRDSKTKIQGVQSHTQQGNDALHSLENQDRHCFEWDDTRNLLWLGVFDGHSGSVCAEFVCGNIINNINLYLAESKELTTTEIKNAMRSGFHQTETQFRELNEPDGTCALLVCLMDETMVVGNIGDSRAIIGSFKGGTSGTNTLIAQQITNEHNASNPEEAKLARFRFLRNSNNLPDSSTPAEYTETELIEHVKQQLDGYDLIENGRILNIQLTRTIGDFGIKKVCYNVVSNEPEFTVVKLKPENQVLILGSDGIWETVSPTRAVNLIYDNLHNMSKYYRESPSAVLVRESVEGGSGDDQTCVVLDLKYYRKCIDDYHANVTTCPLSQSIEKGVFISEAVPDIQHLYSSVGRSFAAKLARLHQKGNFVSSTDLGKFATHLKDTAGPLAREAHTQNPSVYISQTGSPNVLSVFEEVALRQSQIRKKETEEKKKALGTRVGFS